ncbi:DUF3168 domain-containing protein [Pantoea coffeiphila]|uniref:DUF3168 domain-containing protein n=1 Tax=Pantoea coffeiphila TaxID=1465635 RepID=A0A2S9I460_9GAMM|nr:DUF3168 domain-containing protein [Pantoea coffeiphila]PRD12586.1 hypothetical protein CQW29_25460 [Pantoea coffeiphila]
MTEADVYPLLSSLAGGQVYPYVVKLNPQGKPAVEPPWIVFSLSSTFGDVLCGPAEENVSLQIDAYAKTINDARALRSQALSLITVFNPSQVNNQQFKDSETGLWRALLEVQVIN